MIQVRNACDKQYLYITLRELRNCSVFPNFFILHQYSSFLS